MQVPPPQTPLTKSRNHDRSLYFLMFPFRAFWTSPDGREDRCFPMESRQWTTCWQRAGNDSGPSWGVTDKTLCCVQTESQRDSFSGVQMVTATEAQRPVRASAAQPLIEQWLLVEQLCYLCTLQYHRVTNGPSSVRGYPLPGDPGITTVKHYSWASAYTRNFVPSYLNKVMVRNWILQIKHTDVCFHSSVGPRPWMFLQFKRNGTMM